MSPDQWLASQTEEKPAAALSPDQWLAQQQPAEKEPTKLSPDQWLAQQPVEAKTSNPFKGLVARTASLAGEGVEAVARVAESLGDKLETALPLSNLTPEQIKEEQQLQPLFNWANSLRQYGKEIGYEPSTKLGELPGKPLLIVPFIAERLISSAPDMAAAVVATPAYLVALTNETLNERLANDNKPLEEATIADVTAAAGAADRRRSPDPDDGASGRDHGGAGDAGSGWCSRQAVDRAARRGLEILRRAGAGDRGLDRAVQGHRPPGGQPAAGDRTP